MEKVEKKPNRSLTGELSDVFDDLDWASINNCPFICTQNVNLRWLQFRINNRIIGTNSFLFKINILDTDKCAFCKNETETIKHIFFSCYIVKQFWQKLADYVNEKTHSRFDNLSYNLIIFGCKDKTFSFILLVAKHYIYKCKYLNNEISFDVFLRIL